MDNNKEVKTKKKGNSKTPIIIVIIVVVIAVVAGIIYFVSGNKTLTCTQTMDQSQMKMTAEAKIKFSMYKADKVDATFNIELNDRYLSFKDVFIKEFKKQYSTYEKKYEIKPKYEETDKGLKMTFSASNNSFQKVMSISSNKNSYNQVKKDMEKAGYTCK